MAVKVRKKGGTVPSIQESCSNEAMKQWSNEAMKQWSNEAMKQIKLAASGKDQRMLLEEKSNKRGKSNRT